MTELLRLILHIVASLFNANPQLSPPSSSTAQACCTGNSLANTKSSQIRVTIDVMRSASAMSLFQAELEASTTVS